MTTVLITNVKHYVGPGALSVLLREDMHPVCHDSSFEDVEASRSFEKEYPGVIALRAQTPESLISELKERQIDLDAIVSNDVYPNTPAAIEDVSIQTLRDSFDALLLFPFRLTQLLLPAMKQKRRVPLFSLPLPDTCSLKSGFQ